MSRQYAGDVSSPEAWEMLERDPGAVYGQLAGAYYGEQGIPAQWLEQLSHREEMVSLADRLYEQRV